MKVILLQELKGRGGEGDVVEVKRGYAVNYLFPQKLAIEASKGNLKQLELRKHNIAKREAERFDSADKIQAALTDKVLIIPARVGEEGQLFGSVTTQQIADKLKEELGLEIDRKKIDLYAPIKTAGEHSVTVTIYRDVKAVFTVEVVDEMAVMESDEAAAAAEKAATEAVAVAVAADIEEAKELDEDAEALGLADRINETIEVAQANENAREMEEASEAAEQTADALVDAEESIADEATSDAIDEATAEAAVEVLQETGEVLDTEALSALEGTEDNEQ